MPKTRRGKKFIMRFLFLLAAVAAALALAARTAVPRAALSLPELALRELAAPLREGAAGLGRGLAAIPLLFGGIDGLAQENALLKQENALLHLQVSGLQGLERENQALRELLALSRELPDWRPVAAAVTSRSSEGWYHSVTINRGSAHGLAPDMPVMDARGLVGRVVALTPHSAEVLLLIDSESAVAALVAESRWAGVVEAAPGGGGLYFVHLPPQAQLREGQTVISSGLGGLYPYGLPIGMIESVELAENGLSLRALLRPLADFQRLEQVLVLTAPPPEARP